MKLDGRQLSELKACASSPTPTWKGVPPEKADAHLSLYIHHGLVTWGGNGYTITDAGRAALRQKGET